MIHSFVSLLPNHCYPSSYLFSLCLLTRLSLSIQPYTPVAHLSCLLFHLSSRCPLTYSFPSPLFIHRSPFLPDSQPTTVSLQAPRHQKGVGKLVHVVTYLHTQDMKRLCLFSLACMQRIGSAE
ncbi:hypothetical protein E2C01_075225 [Portunus trituberculatus]|uniref:Uncharacterized protein n=1 Tax=Portunus trituberculatus TaxID=210409 RepID=A0A5B7I801_PORTR|nr:hypothetical protein [Portunus trituberculatus]